MQAPMGPLPSLWPRMTPTQCQRTTVGVTPTMEVATQRLQQIPMRSFIPKTVETIHVHEVLVHGAKVEIKHKHAHTCKDVYASSSNLYGCLSSVLIMATNSSSGGGGGGGTMTGSASEQVGAGGGFSVSPPQPSQAAAGLPNFSGLSDVVPGDVASPPAWAGASPIHGASPTLVATPPVYTQALQTGLQQVCIRLCVVLGFVVLYSRLATWTV